jgi:uncharacterized membrane protein (UPF0127 family)
MKWVRLWNQTQDKVLCERCAIADNLVTSIHMFGMKFAIDVVFLNGEDVVVDWVENIAPGKLYAAKVPGFQAENGQGITAKAWKKTYTAKTAIELPAATLAQNPVQIFDQLRREPIDG